MTPDPAIDALDEYVTALQSARTADRETMLMLRPELAGIVQCLDDLERLAAGVDSEDETVQGELMPAKHVAFPDFGKYEVECELGRGGMGVVYKARQKDLDRPVALKMILSGQLATQDQLSRFSDEARLAARLNHPNIISIYEAGELGGQPYFAMQFVEGPSLAQALHRGPMSAEQAARLVVLIARAVDHLHRNNVIHRDLKPSNILLDDAGNPYVTDFGLVKMVTQDSQRTRTGVIVGTPSYMSPEQAAGKGSSVGPASDIYSVGAILYETLTGRPPFREETPLDTLVQVLEGEPRLPRQLNPSLPTDLELICMRALEKDPQRRYASAEALAQDLERHLKGETIDARPASTVERLARWTRRQPALAAHLVTLGACTALAQVGYSLSHVVTLSFHLMIVGILCAWMLASFICQTLLERPRVAEAVRFVWAGLDVVFFTLILHVDDAFLGPLIIGYPLLIAASGLWFRIPIVWFTTAVEVASYLVLLALNWHGVADLHKHGMLLIALVVLGFIVAYQVHRVRALSKYYERRPLP